MAEAPASLRPRTVPPAPKNFPCMRGSGPLSSRGTHSAFSQEQSVTSEPSTGQERCCALRCAVPRRAAHRDRGRERARERDRNRKGREREREREPPALTIAHVGTLIASATCSLSIVDLRARLMTFRQVSIASVHRPALRIARAVFADETGMTNVRRRQSG